MRKRERSREEFLRVGKREMPHSRYGASDIGGREFSNGTGEQGESSEVVARRRRKTAPTNSRKRMPAHCYRGVRTHVTSVPRGEYTAAPLFARTRSQ